MDREGGRLQAGLLGVGGVEDLDGVLVALGPARVHPHQHLGEVGGVHAAGAGADRDDRLAGVVLAGQQGADLELLDGLLELAAARPRPRPARRRRPPPRPSSTITPRSSSRLSSSVKRSSSPCSAESRPVTRCALSWSSQRSGAATCSPRSAISSRMPSRSSTWPDGLHRRLELLDLGVEVGSCHKNQPYGAAPSPGESDQALRPNTCAAYHVAVVALAGRDAHQPVAPAEDVLAVALGTSSSRRDDGPAVRVAVGDVLADPSRPQFARDRAELLVLHRPRAWPSACAFFTAYFWRQSLRLSILRSWLLARLLVALNASRPYFRRRRRPLAAAPAGAASAGPCQQAGEDDRDEGGGECGLAGCAWSTSWVPSSWDLLHRTPSGCRRPNRLQPGDCNQTSRSPGSSARTRRTLGEPATLSSWAGSRKRS